MSTDPRITAIRNDHIVGRGTCSHIDECYTDAELAALLDAAGATTKRSALACCRTLHRIDVDRYNEIRNA